MSTISLSGLDQSDFLCKRFAYLASSYFDRPEEARTPGATVPLENLFRLLQMFRYKAFADERRSGILAIQAPVDQHTIGINGENWHTKIESALRGALNDTFAGIPDEQAIAEIQSALRWLATNSDHPTEPILDRSKSFLDQLTARL